MGHPVLIFWNQLLGRRPERRALLSRSPLESKVQASATIFLILRRMRAPLITLIVIFSVSVLGLTLIPGANELGETVRMDFFDAFYFMSYTATTIGFGELPLPFTAAQRLWVTFSIYLTVIGWAYAIGSLLTLAQDRSFRQALALQRFNRKVVRLREPFFLLAGYGRAGELLGRSFDALAQRFVVIDTSVERIESLDLAPFHSDVPGLVADASNPNHLGIAGLNHPDCAGVLALTDDDEVNLAVTMTATLLRPELPVIARVLSQGVADRMLTFGNPSVVNPFDRFGDHLRIAMRAPASYQLLTWLEAGPGAELPPRGLPPTAGRWVICGYGRFGRELTADLRAEGLQVTVIEPELPDDARLDVPGPDVAGGALGPDLVAGHGFEPGVLERAELRAAVGFVAGTNNDTTNLSMLAAARRVNPALFLAARQNRPSSAPLFAAMNLDALLVPTEVVAHEVYAQLSTPLLWRFIEKMPSLGDAWAADLIERLSRRCGRQLETVWKCRLDRSQAPALAKWLASGEVRLGDLLRSPEDRDRTLHIVPLLVARGNDVELGPDDDFVLALDDEMLFVGRPADRRELDATFAVPATTEYVLFDRRIPASWVWRRMTGESLTRAE